MLFDGALGLSSTAPANTPVHNGAVTSRSVSCNLQFANRKSSFPIATTSNDQCQPLVFPLPMKNITLSLLNE